MQAMWSEITTPVAPRPWPWSRMWIGVIVITATITICVSTIAAAASWTPPGDDGCAGTCSLAASASASALTSPSAASASGGGAGMRARRVLGLRRRLPPRDQQRVGAQLQLQHDRGGRVGGRREQERAGEAGIPSCSATWPIASTRLGPATAPTVVATSTMLTARPRRAGSARSAPA